ncbi:CopG family transcriptional regulator [Caulobacter sp.]|uniref:ribbon-helix-helix domain-containing protein n=1 Tax=Caulobacter sp. TaxID=78 RepID=UPI003BABDC3C
MKPRHHLYLDDALTEQLDRLGGKPGTSKSAIVADALRAYLDRRAASELDALFKVRLDRMSRQLGRIERDQKILLESLALFVRYQLTVTAPLPEADKAAQAVGRERFQRFVDQVGRQLASGRQTLGAEDLDGGEGAR